MMRSGADFSDDRVYRYSLWREWLPRKSRVLFCMLNPSTADENRNDPTVERCQVRAMRDGFGSFEVVNLFALRGTNPACLTRAGIDPVGHRNNLAIAQAVGRAQLIVCGWGSRGQLYGRDQDVLKLICTVGGVPHCLKLNSDGTPQHPLYLAYKLRPIKMEVLQNAITI